MTVADVILRTVLTAAHKLMMVRWYLHRPRVYGAHALALTPQRRLILVKLRYAAGWRVPGGGRKPDEEPVAAALRELREEIGMVGHGRVRVAGEQEEEVNHRRDRSTLLIVEDVQYRPHKWSLEVEQVGEFPLDALPLETHGTVLRWLPFIERGG
jgi:8-oxo-dGTP pyrophosphatase MutT (NUDIX family)